MRNPSVCAVVVTYQPRVEMLDHLREISAQVGSLVVVDNGSGANEISALREASRTRDFQLVENGHNLGIAEALNQGVRWAKAEGYAWAILFDQDSKITDGFVREMFAAWESRTDRDLVAAVHPRYSDPSTGVELSVPRAPDGSPILPMTSGSLVPLWIFERIGFFESQYFIDVVDWEYAFRIRASGYVVADANRARLLHAAGCPERRRILGRDLDSSHHNAVRRYYISRNSVVFYRKYFSRFPKWILFCIYRQMRDLLVCGIAERDRWHKFRNFFLGTWDGLRGKMGQREGI